MRRHLTLSRGPKPPEAPFRLCPFTGKLGFCAEKAGDKWPEEDPYVMKPIDTDVAAIDRLANREEKGD